MTNNQAGVKAHAKCAVFVALVAADAIAIPVARATRIEPAAALREDAD
jgi:hypothetical protein